MKNWWVPGCTIGYEHTFINSFADFLASLEGGEPFQPDMKCRPADPEGLRGRARQRQAGPVGRAIAADRRVVDSVRWPHELLRPRPPLPRRSPYFLAGTAVPDWLSVVDRRVRVRSKTASRTGRRRRSAAGGRGAGHRAASSRRRLVPRHAGLRRTEPAIHGLRSASCWPRDAGFRASFLGHILVEIAAGRRA